MTIIKQNNIEIGDKILPEITYNQIVYYPFSYTIEQILIKKRQPIKKLKENGYNNYIVKLCVDYGFNGGGSQNTYCISKEGLVRLLNSSYIGGFTVEQKKSMNLLLDYLGMDLINEKPRFIDDYDYEGSGKYDEFEKDCITETLKIDNSLKWQLCKDCEKYYPLHTNFFRYNTRDKIMGTICHTCIYNDGTVKIIHPTFQSKSIEEIKDIKELQIKLNDISKNYNVFGIYDSYIKSGTSHYPKQIQNKEDYLLIITDLYEKGKINKDKLTMTYLIQCHNLKNISSYITIYDIYKHLFGNHPEQFPWNYPSYRLKPVNIEKAIIIFNNYLNENNIVIEDVFNFDYYDIAKRARIGKKYYSDILKFVMNYHGNKYPAYKFNIASVNYWKEQKHRVMALKYLIEEDMKLEIEKIPLYLTITSIRNIARNMYNVLKNYYSNLYEWVNEVYPNIFDPKDFDINYMRNEFDSIDEQTIHDILRNNFENVLYNPKHTEHTITLLGKIPDWFVFTTTGAIIVEYFGLWVKKRGMYNSRTRDYIISSKDKIEKYKTLQGYKFLYLYPEDLENNYEGIHKKINEIKKIIKH